MAKRYFTKAEANALLPIIRTDLLALQNVKQNYERKLVELHKAKHALHTSGTAGVHDPLFTIECEIEFLQIEAQTLADSFHLKGVELKDINYGLVDFPALLDGKEILLCWKLGESAVNYYHGYDDGYAGRKQIDSE